MNNTEKLDDVRRRVRRAETELAVIRRTVTWIVHYFTGESVVDFMTEREREILFGGRRSWIREFTGEAAVSGRILARYERNMTVTTTRSGDR